jgi:hypothetical protein
MKCSVELNIDNWKVVMSHLKATTLFTGDESLRKIHDDMANQIIDQSP